MKRFGCLAGLTLGGMIILAQTSGTSETVTTKFERAIPNIPGKSLVSQVVDYAPGGALTITRPRKIGLHLCLRRLGCHRVTGERRPQAGLSRR